MSSVRFKPRVTKITKTTKFGIVWLNSEKFEIRRDIIKCGCRETIYEICGGGTSIGPISEWHMGMLEKRKKSFYNMSMSSFGIALVLRSMGRRSKVTYAINRQILVK